MTRVSGAFLSAPVPAGAGAAGAGAAAVPERPRGVAAVSRHGWGTVVRNLS